MEIDERTDLAKFREELREPIRNLREKRIEGNIEEEAEDLEKCMGRGEVGRQASSHIINCISD